MNTAGKKMPPWAPGVFGAAGVVNTMLQEIALGDKPPDEAWRAAVARKQEVVGEWKVQHPDWQPPDCT